MSAEAAAIVRSFRVGKRTVTTAVAELVKMTGGGTGLIVEV